MKKNLYLALQHYWDSFVYLSSMKALSCMIYWLCKPSPISIYLGWHLSLIICPRKIKKNYKKHSGLMLCSTCIPALIFYVLPLCHLQFYPLISVSPYVFCIFLPPSPDFNACLFLLCILFEYQRVFLIFGGNNDQKWYGKIHMNNTRCKLKQRYKLLISSCWWKLERTKFIDRRMIFWLLSLARTCT